MAQFNDLSTEILLLVCAYLPAADKATISRVCKWLQQIAEPMLYADIQLRWNFPFSNMPLHLLVLKISKPSVIASHVKRLQITGSRSYTFKDGPRRDWLSDKDFEIVSDLARDVANTGDEDGWIAVAEQGNSDLYQAMLISRLPNLAQLTVGYDRVLNFRFVSKLFQRVLCSEKVIGGLSKFLHLKRVDLCVDMTVGDYLDQARGVRHQLSQLLPFFYLPSIQDLRIVMPHDTNGFSWPVTQPCTQSLTSLSLRRSNASEALLARILAVTPNLKCLDYDFISAEWPRYGPTSLCAEGLGKALAHVKATLEQLTVSVDFEQWIEYEYEDFSSQYSIKGCLSLHDYESLVILELPVALLLGHSPTPQTRLTGRLPPRIRQLYLRDDMVPCVIDWTVKVVVRLLRDHLSGYRAQTADLEILKLKLNWIDKSLDDFRDFCEDINLTLKLV